MGDWYEREISEIETPNDCLSRHRFLTASGNAFPSMKYYFSDFVTYQTQPSDAKQLGTSCV
jgi:hypothetical protein